MQHQYKGLGLPYAEDLDQAISILGRISDNAQAVLADRNSRGPIDPEREPYSWRTFFISPLWAEYQRRQDWWQATRELGFRISKNPSGFSAIEKLEKRLESKGQETKEHFEFMRKKAGELIQEFQEEARTPTQFQEQIEQLQLLDKQISQTIETFLPGNDFSPRKVSSAAPRLMGYREGLAKSVQALKQSKEIRRDTRTQLEKNQAAIETIEALLAEEEVAGHPVQTLREALSTEINEKEEQKRQSESGNYLSSDAQAQHQRLQELEKNLRLLIQERMKLEDRLTRSEREIGLTEAWINTIAPPLIIDQTDKALEEMLQQQSRLYQLLRTSENLALLTRQDFIDPEELASKRTLFDQRVKTFQSLHQDLQHQIPPVIERSRTSIQNLHPLNPGYHRGLDLNLLAEQTRTLEDGWAEAKTPGAIKESQIDLLTIDLRQLEKNMYQINRACQRAEDQFLASATDRADAIQIIEDQAFTELHQVMLVISREDQVSLSERAGEYTRRAEQLNSDVDKIGTNFAATTREASQLLAEMKTVWRSYQKSFAGEKKEWNLISEKLIACQSDLKKFETHELSVLRSKVSAPLKMIDNWQQLLPPQSIQALTDHNDDGYSLQIEMEKIVKEIFAQEKEYSWAKADADAAISEAKTTINKAERELGRIPWGESKPDDQQKSRRRSPALEHSYRYLDTAEAAYREITSPEIEYNGSVEKAVSDLAERVSQSARHAKDEAAAIQAETREQIREIDQKRKDLEKTLADGEGYSLRLEDTGFRSQWQQIYRKYSQFESELANQSSYREAFSYLEQALIESRYQIERMQEFDTSR